MKIIHVFLKSILQFKRTVTYFLLFFFLLPLIVFLHFSYKKYNTTVSAKSV